MTEEFEIRWLGWNNSANHDKVWGYMVMKDDRIYAFWGRRGKSLRFKQHYSIWDADVLASSKSKKGYTYVPPSKYNELVSDFIDQLKIDCMVALLGDKVMPVKL